MERARALRAAWSRCGPVGGASITISPASEHAIAYTYPSLMTNAFATAAAAISATGATTHHQRSRAASLAEFRPKSLSVVRQSILGSWQAGKMERELVRPPGTGSFNQLARAQCGRTDGRADTQVLHAFASPCSPAAAATAMMPCHSQHRHRQGTATPARSTGLKREGKRES